MATAIDMDTVLANTPWTAYGVGSTNTPIYWTNAQNEGIDVDPLDPQDAVLHVRMEEGAYEVVLLGDTGLRQRVTGLQMCPNMSIATYERFIFPDTAYTPPVDATEDEKAAGRECDRSEWSEWLKVDA